MKGEKKRARIRGVFPIVQDAARVLRREATEAEQVMWQALRGQKLKGLKFRRQHPLGQVIVDFYCPVHSLAVELDGGIHDHQQEQDAARTQHLSAYGCRVLRFRNEEVLSDLPTVLVKIVEATLPNASS